MIGGYQIISLHSTNNVLGTSYSIKGLYKRVKKTIKQIKLEDLIIDNIKMENVFINVHLDGDNYVGTFGLYQITFKSDDTYTIEENSGGSSGLYFVTTDSYSFSFSSNVVSYDNCPNLKQLYLDQPSMCILSRVTRYQLKYPTSGTLVKYVMFVLLKENVYVSLGINYNSNSNSDSYFNGEMGNIYLTLTETGFIYNTSL